MRFREEPRSIISSRFTGSEVALFTQHGRLDVSPSIVCFFSCPVENFTSRKRKSFKLAPFKLNFSKMSRGGNRRKNDIGEANKNETSEEIQDSDGNVLAINAKSMIPNFPPPSYEHVLEEARLEQSTATNDNEGETDEMGRIRTGRVNNCTNEVANERIPRNVKGPEILHKSSKELYRAVAKQWGITCKMSDHCRCFDCQSHYFDCDSEKNEQCKSDGGLSAGTPMFISEVIHGTACSLL